jgi:hypothetical protein
MPRWLDMTGQLEHRLARAMASLTDSRSSLSTPLRVAVHGLPGVGSTAVAAALAGLSLFRVVSQQPDLTVRVVAEVVKPEDLAELGKVTGPVLVVLNKADLCGWGAGGPVETARRRCARLAELTGAPTEPMVGLLACAALDRDVLDSPMFEALRVLAGTPGDLRTADTFLSGPHPVPTQLRERLIDALDVFGIAHAVVTLRDDSEATPDAVRAVLRRVSGVDGIAARIEALGAEVRYRRLLALVGEWDARAVTDSDVADLLLSDDVVLARMAAAVDVIAAAGLPVDLDDRTPDPPAAHLRRAVRWRNYGAGPVTPVHRACAADITRGSLRLWGAAR